MTKIFVTYTETIRNGYSQRENKTASFCDLKELEVNLHKFDNAERKVTGVFLGSQMTNDALQINLGNFLRERASAKAEEIAANGKDVISKLFPVTEES